MGYWRGGIFSSSPICIRAGLRPGLAASNLVTVMPYWRAMLVGLSPRFTLCMRIVAGRGGLGTVLPPGIGRGGSVAVVLVTGTGLGVMPLESS